MRGRARQNTRSFQRHKREFFERCRRERPVCWLCGQPIDYDVEPGTSPDSLSLDHRFPVSVRPDLQDDPTNFEAAHFSCNVRRGNADPPDSLGTLSRDWLHAPRA